MGGKVNSRPSFVIDSSEPVAQNYYPVTSMISSASDGMDQHFGVITDRAQGGTSLQVETLFETSQNILSKDGSLELMVHRRLLYDDHFGVGEALDETQYGVGLVARGGHHLVVKQDRAEFNKALR